MEENYISEIVTGGVTYKIHDLELRNSLPSTTVLVTQTQTSGVKIADIKVNNTTTSIFAPNNTSSNNTTITYTASTKTLKFN